jgi:hypothetical protein
MQKHNAIGKYTCDTCPFWHNPQGLPIGLCLREPPKPLMIGMAPSSPLARPGPGMDIQPVIRGYFPTCGAKDGCGQHPRRFNGGVMAPRREEEAELAELQIPQRPEPT